MCSAIESLMAQVVASDGFDRVSPKRTQIRGMSLAPPMEDGAGQPIRTRLWNRPTASLQAVVSRGS